MRSLSSIVAIALIFSLVCPAPVFAVPSVTGVPRALEERVDRLFRYMDSEGMTVLDSDKRPISRADVATRLGELFYIEVRANGEMPNPLLLRVQTRHSSAQQQLRYSLTAIEERTDRVLSRRMVTINYATAGERETATRLFQTSQSMGQEIQRTLVTAARAPGVKTRIVRVLNQLFGMGTAHADIAGYIALGLVGVGYILAFLGIAHAFFQMAKAAFERPNFSASAALMVLGVAGLLSGMALAYFDIHFSVQQRNP